MFYTNCIYLFVWLCFFVSLENFSLVWRRYHCRWRAANFDLCSALRSIEQWGFFNVPHLLRHRPTVYIGHLRGPVTLTPNAERFAIELSLSVFKTLVCCSRMRGECSTSTPPRRSTKIIKREINVKFSVFMLYFFHMKYKKCIQNNMYIYTKSNQNFFSVFKNMYIYCGLDF